jgi:hypothetical protein
MIAASASAIAVESNGRRSTKWCAQASIAAASGNANSGYPPKSLEESMGSAGGSSPSARAALPISSGAISSDTPDAMIRFGGSW